MVVTGLDVILVVVVLISALLAMTRGLTREVFAVASWVLAVAAAAVAYFRFREPFAQEFQFDPPIIGDAILVGGTFVATLIIISFITMRLSDIVMESKAGALDRTLGFIYGGVRGLLLVVVGYFLFSLFQPLESQPSWLADARSRPLIESTGETVISWLPQDFELVVRQALGREGTDEATN